MAENYLSEQVAKGYEARWPHLFDPAVVNPAVSFLAGLAGTGAALELGIEQEALVSCNETSRHQRWFEQHGDLLLRGKRAGCVRRVA